MDSFLSQYKNRVGPLLKPLGFKIYNGRHFAKLIPGEVVQSFTLVRVPGLYICHARFGIIPLCFGSIGYLREGDELSELWGEYRFGMEYNPGDEARIDEIITFIESGVKDYLIPHFQRSQTCGEAYEALLDFEKISGRGGYIPDEIKLLFSLKIGKYEQAAVHLRGFLESYKAGIDKIINSPYDDEDGRRFRLDRVKKRIKAFTELLYYVEHNDKERIDQILKIDEENLTASYKARKMVTVTQSFFP